MKVGVDMEYSCSVDMISFVSVMTDNEFMKYNSCLQMGDDCVIWVGTGIKQYRYNYKIEIGTSSCYVGYQHNSEKYEGGYHSLKIEFNPNKVDVTKDSIVCDLLKYCCRRNETKVKSIDVAFDLRVPFENYIVDRGLKHNVNTYKGTVYIGSRSNGIKVYDKQKESGLPYPLTRYELRVPLNCLFGCIGLISCGSSEFDSLPTITFVNTLPIDTFDRVVILGLMQDPNALNSFSRRRKEKYRKYLQQFEQFSPSSNEIIQCILEYIKQLKNELNLVVS